MVSDKSSLVAELPAVDVGTVDAGDVSVRLMSRRDGDHIGRNACQLPTASRRIRSSMPRFAVFA